MRIVRSPKFLYRPRSSYGARAFRKQSRSSRPTKSVPRPIVSSISSRSSTNSPCQSPNLSPCSSPSSLNSTCLRSRGGSAPTSPRRDSSPLPSSLTQTRSIKDRSPDATSRSFGHERERLSERSKNFNSSKWLKLSNPRRLELKSDSVFAQTSTSLPTLPRPPSFNSLASCSSNGSSDDSSDTAEEEADDHSEEEEVDLVTWKFLYFNKTRIQNVSWLFKRGMICFPGDYSPTRSRMENKILSQGRGLWST